jgi:hypothetical protein
MDNAARLIGNWKLLSSTTVLAATGELLEDFGPKPRGSLILTPQGRMAALLTKSERRFGESDAERALLFHTMIAYSGRYRVEGDRFITTVDVSWNEVWNGTELVRHFRFEDERLLIETSPFPGVRFQGRIIIGRLAWERES